MPPPDPQKHQQPFVNPLNPKPQRLQPNVDPIPPNVPPLKNGKPNKRDPFEQLERRPKPLPLNPKRVLNAPRRNTPNEPSLQKNAPPLP